MWDPKEVDKFWQAEIALRQQAYVSGTKILIHEIDDETCPLHPSGWDYGVGRPTGGHTSEENGE